MSHRQNDTDFICFFVEKSKKVLMTLPGGKIGCVWVWGGQNADVKVNMRMLNLVHWGNRSFFQRLDMGRMGRVKRKQQL